MDKLIEFSETIARAGAFLPAGISHAKRIIFGFRKLYCLYYILTGIYIKFWKQYLPGESLSI